MKQVQSGPVRWNILDEEAYQNGQESEVSFDSFLGASEEELKNSGFSLHPKDEKVRIIKEKGTPKIVFTDDKESVSFEAYYTPEQMWIWQDIRHSQLITAFNKYDFTFYKKAANLFKSIPDFIQGFTLLSKNLDESEVDRYYILVQESSSGRFTVTIGRHKDKPKKEKRYRFFAASIQEFVENVVKCLAEYMKEVLSKDVYIEEKEEKRQDEELDRG